MADAALVRKLKLKPGMQAAVVGAPEGYLDALKTPPDGVQLVEGLNGSFDWIQAFVKDRAELERVLPKVVKALKPDTVVWLSYPKGSSGLQTDLTRDKGWESLATTELMWVNLISVDERWSAFGLRPYRQGEARQTFR